jgi:hypothetical protein
MLQSFQDDSPGTLINEQKKWIARVHQNFPSFWMILRLEGSLGAGLRSSARQPMNNEMDCMVPPGSLGSTRSATLNVCEMKEDRHDIPPPHRRSFMSASQRFMISSTNHPNQIRHTQKQRKRVRGPSNPDGVSKNAAWSYFQRTIASHELVGLRDWDETSGWKFFENSINLAYFRKPERFW